MCAGKPAVLLVTASWCGPCGPAPTLLAELSRRWGDAVQAVLVEDPDDDVLEALAVEQLPSWLRLEVASSGAGSSAVSEGPPVVAAPAGPDELSSGASAGGELSDSADREHFAITDLTGRTPSGEPIILKGRWTITYRREGALPKHVIHQEFMGDPA